MTRVADGPSAGELGGRGLAAALKRGVLATRPDSFTASVLPVLVGTAWGAAEHGRFDGAKFALVLLR
jgi:1,4-dihydroxy-2-naphthoate octaprenyltransferase